MVWLPVCCVWEVANCVQYVSSNMFQIRGWQDGVGMSCDVFVGDMV